MLWNIGALRQATGWDNGGLVRSNGGWIIRPHRIGQLGRIDLFAGRPFREIWWPISRHGTPPFKYRLIDGLIYIGCVPSSRTSLAYPPPTMACAPTNQRCSTLYTGLGAACTAFGSFERLTSHSVGAKSP